MLLALTIVACGFQLRGKAKAELPAFLQVMRVSLADNKATNAPLLVDIRQALTSQAGVRLVAASETNTAQLILSGEQTSNRVLSVSTAGKVNAYLLEYRVSFRVIGVDGKQIGKSQTIVLQRDYTFDPLNVLAKEREEQFLRQQLRRDAVQQILRRLTHLKPSA